MILAKKSLITPCENRHFLNEKRSFEWFLGDRAALFRNKGYFRTLNRGLMLIQLFDVGKMMKMIDFDVKVGIAIKCKIMIFQLKNTLFGLFLVAQAFPRHVYWRLCMCNRSPTVLESLLHVLRFLNDLRRKWVLRVNTKFMYFSLKNTFLH